MTPSAPNVATSQRPRALSTGRLLGALLASAAVAIALLALLAWRAVAPQRAEHFTGAPPQPSGELGFLWPAPSFSLTAQDGRKLSEQSLRGRPYIADFIYTQCRNVCPAMTAKFVMVQRKLAQHDLAFVSFSVDPDHDTPQALADFARSFSSDSRWALLATEHDSLQRIAGGFRVAADRTNDPTDPIIHTDIFFLVDAQGQVRGVYPSRDADELERLQRDAARLAAPLPPTVASSRPDVSAYERLGCGGCHSQRSLAPPLVNLLGAERMLEGGIRVTIDAAYLKTSILEPARQVVAGYPPIMPSYAGRLSEQELAALLAELAERKMSPRDAPAPEAAAPVRIVEDPVCHMQVRAEPSTPHVRHQGQDIYFCAQMCKEAFEKEPARYPRKTK